MEEFSQDAVAELFTSYLRQNRFQALPHDAGKAAMEDILKIDYRPYLKDLDFMGIYQRECVAILVRHGSTQDNAAIFSKAIEYITNNDNGFGDEMKKFIDRFVRTTTVFPPDDVPSEFPSTSYGEIVLQGFDPDVHITEAGEFNFAPAKPDTVDLYHNPDKGLTISAGLSTAGALIMVSGPVTPAVMIVGAAIVVGAIVLKKILKKSC